MSTMLCTQQTPPLVAVATRSHKTINQDAAALLAHPYLPIAGVAIADGLGSHFGADESARTAVAAAAMAIESVDSISDVRLPPAFGDARRAIERAVRDRAAPLPADLCLADAFGTTLLCALDLPDRLVAGYVGNGAIIHLRGDFHEFSATQLMPRSACNYLNPHSRMQRGANVLYKWLGPVTTVVQSTPTVLEIGKDDLLSGDLLLVCSDGICSFDQTPIGLDSDRQMWIRADLPLSILYEHLRRFIEREPLTGESLEACLDRYLDDLESRQLIGDDCSVGTIVTGDALRRYMRLRAATAAVAS